MKSIFVGLFCATFLIMANAQCAELICDYQFYGAPFASISLVLGPEGQLPEGARISMQGNSHFESVTPDLLQAGQMIHLWLSKENPQNAIEMIVYKEEKAAGNSEIINNQMPLGKEVWGHCK